MDANLMQRAHLWRAKDLSPSTERGLASGFAELDALLPSQGWPVGALTEILSAHQGIGALSLVMPALVCLSSEQRWITWVAPPYIPYAPALAEQGMELSRVLVVHERKNRDTLWALEQALRSGACSAVLGWLPKIDSRALRRLQLAAEAGASWGLLFRPLEAMSEASPAALRLQVSPSAGELGVQVLKCRGGWAGGSTRIDVRERRRMLDS